MSSLAMLCTAFGYFFYSYDANHTINDDDSPIARPTRVMYFLLFLATTLNFVQVLGMLGFEPMGSDQSRPATAYGVQPYEPFEEGFERRSSEFEALEDGPSGLHAVNGRGTNTTSSIPL